MEHGLSKTVKENTNFSALLNTYNRNPVEFTYGSGASLYDTEGKEYLDFLSGIAVTSFGHNNEEIKEAVIDQVEKLWHVSNLFTSSQQEKLAQILTEKSGLKSVFFCNSGTEANEAAIKFARKWGNGKTEIITAKNGFHGRTYGSLSATGQEKLHNNFHPMLPGFTYAEFGNMDSIKNAVNENTAAVMLEIIQGEGGVNTADEFFWKELDSFCKEKNILLIIDEIQTGIGRTGKFFAYQNYNVQPDIVTSAKALANGIPLGAAICGSKISSVIEPGSHGSTFGGNLIAVAAAIKVTEMLNDELLDSISELGQTLSNGLHGLHLPQIVDVRGKGLMIGIELSGISAKVLASKLFDEGFVVGTAGEKVIRLLPPFIITKMDIMKFLVAFKKAISELLNEKH